MKFFYAQDKVWENDFTDGVSKMKIKKTFFFSSNIYSKDNQLAGYRDSKVGLFPYRISNISNYNPLPGYTLFHLALIFCLITWKLSHRNSSKIFDSLITKLFFDVHSFHIIFILINLTSSKSSISLLLFSLSFFYVLFLDAAVLFCYVLQ